MNSSSIVMLVTRLSIDDWAYFETRTLLATLRTRNQFRGESYESLEAEHLYPSVGCARSKHHYPTVRPNLKSFRWMLAGLRMDGLLALDFWDVVIEVLRSTTLQNMVYYPKETSAGQETIPSRKRRPKHQLKDTSEMFSNCQNVDYVPTNTHCSQGESQLYIFEDIEVVIKMIIKARSPAMRHVSRTHRVALDWLFEIQFKYVDTKIGETHQSGVTQPVECEENLPQDLGYPVDPGKVDERQGSQTSTRKLVCTTQMPRSRVFSSEATRKCPKFRCLETKRQGGIVELCQYKETFTGSDSEDSFET